MKTKKFKYTKKGTDEIKDYNVLVLNETPTHFAGIDLNKLSDEDQKKVLEIQQKYEEDLYPYTKTAYRQFIVENVVS